MTETKRRLRIGMPYALVIAMALLAIGTVSNQLKINAANNTLRRQAENGQRALNRQCALLPVSKKIYADALDRRVISADDLAAILSTAAAVCPRR